jgi:hypothetical protein
MSLYSRESATVVISWLATALMTLIDGGRPDGHSGLACALRQAAVPCCEWRKNPWYWLFRAVGPTIFPFVMTAMLQCRIRYPENRSSSD